MSSWVDRRWTGIIDVLVAGLDGAVRWEADSVVLKLPGSPRVGRVADLDLLRLCLDRAGVPVVFNDSSVTAPDTPLAEFLMMLVESGLMVDEGPLTARDDVTLSSRSRQLGHLDVIRGNGGPRPRKASWNRGEYV